MENCHKNVMIAAEFRKSNEGERLETIMRYLNEIASKLLNCHKEETCCSEHSRHFEFQCPSNKDEPVIATLHTWNYAHLGMKEVEQFFIFMTCYMIML